MNILLVSVIILAYFNTLHAKHLIGIDESWICGIKASCLSCLSLPHCSWCPIDSKCFSLKLEKDESYCQNNTILHTEYGMSLEENAECACVSALVSNCRPPGDDQASECSGRGSCVCGRCSCNPTPDPENPSKVIMGEYCEYDNFSCDGPKCNEGPYSIHDDMTLYEENNLGNIPRAPEEE